MNVVWQNQSQSMGLVPELPPQSGGIRAPAHRREAGGDPRRFIISTGSRRKVQARPSWAGNWSTTGRSIRRRIARGVTDETQVQPSARADNRPPLLAQPGGIFPDARVQARLEQEFPQGASEFQRDELSAAASCSSWAPRVALAGLGLTGCRRPELHGVPYTKGVDGRSRARRSTTRPPCPGAAARCPSSPRPTTAAPPSWRATPTSPATPARTDALAQAAILDLYDPDRSKTVLKAGERGKDYTEGTMEDFWRNSPSCAAIT